MGGVVRTHEVRAATLRVAGGATLTHHQTTDPVQPQSLTITVDDDLVVEADAAIDATAIGFAANVSYPDVGTPGSNSGGSHMGEGGVSSSPAGETFGSVERPREPGGGASTAGRGGGAVTVVADRVRVDGTILANGESSSRGGAGGSVWIRTSVLAGTGSIEVRGGSSCCGLGSGSGGAISIEYASTEAESTLLDDLDASTVDVNRRGGAGTIFLLGPDSSHGDLVVDNNGISGRVTDLPSLGAGVAQAGSGGDIVVTDRVSIPEYFVGHWVRVETPERLIRGTWRIAGIEGAAFALAPNGTEQIDVADGDEWHGLYRFDSVTVTGGATLQSIDPVEEILAGFVSAALAWGNADAPTLDPAGITVSNGAEAGSYRVEVAPWAVADRDGVAELRLSDGECWISVPWSPATGTTIRWNGSSIRALTLIAIDGHDLVREATSLRLPPLSGPVGPGGAERPEE